MQKTTRSGSAPHSRGGEPSVPLPPAARRRSASQGIPPISPKKKNKCVTKTSKKVKTLAESCSIAMSRTESVLVSATGDVMVSRCRRSSTPYLTNVPGITEPNICWDSDFGAMSDFMSTIDVPWSNKLTNGANNIPRGDESVTSGVSSYEWEKLDKQVMKKKKKNISKSEPKRIIKDPPAKNAPQESGVELVFSSIPSKNSDQSDTVGIISMPSFDYSHIHEGNNDMIPPNFRMKKSTGISTIHESPFEEKKDEDDAAIADTQPFFHGVPVFLTSLSQIRITKVSANPLGAHVLMISAEALLLTYGLNNHGQLGIGIKSSLRDGSRGFVTSPTLVTPLLENGGKTINCAAGIDHSLVVVSTEGRRLQKIKKRCSDQHSDDGAVTLKRQASSPSRFETDDDEGGIDMSDESVQHHQVYGFGHNDFMKVGLINASLEGDSDLANEDEDILLPHRVALHCTVWPEDNSSAKGSLPPQGIFDIAASAEHSAALMRRPTGDVELYMWGNASMGALGKFDANGEKVVVKGEIGKKPMSNVASVFPHPTLIEDLSYTKKDSTLGVPISLALGRYCSFVLMSSGRCMSFGFSAEGMLGQGFGMMHTGEPKEIFLPQQDNSEASNTIVAVSTGACHVLCITADGGTWSWGVDKDGRLGLRVDDFSSFGPGEEDAQTLAIEWVPQRINIKQHASRSYGASAEDSTTCVQVCAGYDSSILLMRSGQVLSFGKKSGRLGKGEIDADVFDPQPLHGGLCLFHQADEDSKGRLNAKVPPGVPSRKHILRARSDL
mmetsp:Transcript_25785/g.63148  ORF Transcript_25785/g.63148 Transcript_25785/m.63148 type:complete len:780 (+) Transcript_25785:247-2586(+)|eukprot:CAMPEP_0113628474 /NCGR_PEP_ID=MMETSP0017_2-20120614/14754_1 /TAXON_ID=2856 /ORGANISM="Cylindrotheca closterium" /LENGTH=779 /DNA_ID=CAMNT_0000538781 /DNA_START=139 /DNA_END=2478 /DNA_ORIENTATION=- /assembly_acc=CAM_ASM_000147